MLLILLCCFYRSSHRRCSVRKDVLRDLAKFTGNTCASFLIKLQAWGLQLYLKRDTGTGIFLWVFQIFEEHLFERPFASGWLLLFLFFLNMNVSFSEFIMLTTKQKAFNILVWDLTLCRIFFRLINFNWKGTL